MASRYLITGGGSVVWTAVDTSIWSATSGGATGASVPGSGDDVIMDGSSGGGTVTLGYSPTVNSIVMGAYTGHFDVSTYSPTMATFSCSGTAVRTLSMGSGTWSITGNNGTIFNINTSTNLTLNPGTSTVDFTYSGSTGTRTVAGPNNTFIGNVKVSAGSDTFASSGLALYWANVDYTGFTGTGFLPTRISGNLTLGTGMTISSSTNLTTFTSTSGTKTITSNGVAIDRPITFDGVGGTWQLVDAMTVGSSRTVTLTNGTLDTNGQTCSWGTFSSSNSNTRVLTLGASTISLTGTGTITPWNCQTSTNMTLNAGTSTLSFATSSQAPTMQGGGLTYYNLSITSTSGGFTIGQNNTFNNITFAQGAGNRTFTLGTSTTQTVNGVLTLTGFNVNQSRLRVQSNTFGTQCMFALGTTGTVAITNVDFSDIAFTGTNAPVSGTSLGDIGGNSGITFTPARTVYWVGGTGNMADTTSWSLTSGGASGAAVPLCQDTAIFDANSFSAPGQTVSQNVFRCGTIDFSAATNNPTWSFLNSSGAGLLIVGNLTLASGMTTTAASASGGTCAVTMAGRGSQTITSNGVALGTGVSLEINSVGGTYTLQDSLVMSDTGRTLTCTRGTFNANGYNVTCGLFSSSNSNTRTLTMGSGTWTLTGTGTVFNTSTTTGLTFSGASATIAVTDASSALKTLTIGAPVTPIGRLTISPGGTGPVSLSMGGGRTITTMDVTGPKTVQFMASTTLTVGTFNITSSRSQPVSFLSSTPGTQYTLSVASGTVGSRFMSILDCIGSGGATFVARESYGNNTTGWTIVPPRINLDYPQSSVALQFPGVSTSNVTSSAVTGVSSNGSYSLGGLAKFFRTNDTQIPFGFNANPVNPAVLLTSTEFLGGFTPLTGILTSTVRPQLGQWHHVFITYDSSGTRDCLYLNGYLVYTRSGSATAFTDGVVILGRFAFSASSPQLGPQSRFCLYNRELSADEVMQLAKGYTTPTSGLRVQYNYTEGSGAALADVSGNGNNGTITGATWVVDRPVTARSAASNRQTLPATTIPGRSAASNRVQL